MVLANELSPLHWVGSYNLTIVLPPLALSFDKVMGIYPRFEGVFVLGRQRCKGSDKNLFGEDYDIFVIALSLIVVSSSR